MKYKEVISIDCKKLLYGDLVKFIVEFQNQNGRNIQYNNFLFEMGNWRAEPGFNSESNDQFSRIVNNNKKPVNAFYKYNDKIISHLCNIVDKDISIFPIDTEKRNDLMNAIVGRFLKNGNSDNKYKKIEEYYSNKDFENFMIATFDLAHFNSVNYFNDKRKKEHSLNVESHEITKQGEIERPNGKCDLYVESELERFNDKKEHSLNKEFHEITGQGELEWSNGRCDLFAEGESERFNDKKEHSLNEESHEITGQGELERPNVGYDLFAKGEPERLNDKKKNVLHILNLILAFIIVVFLFINRIVCDSHALPSAKEPRLDSTQLHVPVNDEIDSGINPPVNNKKEQETEKNVSVNKDGGAAQTNPGLNAVPKDGTVKQHQNKKTPDRAASQEHKLTAKERESKSQENSDSKKKDIKTGTDITINGNGVVIIGDKNIVNVH